MLLGILIIQWNVAWMLWIEESHYYQSPFLFPFWGFPFLAFFLLVHKISGWIASFGHQLDNFSCYLPEVSVKAFKLSLSHFRMSQEGPELWMKTCYSYFWDTRTLLTVTGTFKHSAYHSQCYADHSIAIHTCNCLHITGNGLCMLSPVPILIFCPCRPHKASSPMCYLPDCSRPSDGAQKSS